MQPRRARAEDAAAVSALVERAYAPYVARMGRRPQPMDDDHAAEIAGTTADEVWVVPGPGGAGIIGVLVLVRHEDHLLLHNVAVHPDHHGAGTGSTLLDLAEERARALGLATVRLCTHLLMTENQRRYERRGYVETHRGGPPGMERVHYARAVPRQGPPRAP